MTSSALLRRRTRLAGATALACAVVAGTLASLAGGTAAAAPLPAPPVVGPSSAGPVLKQVTLDWAPVAGATSYVVQVGTDEEWSDAPTLERTTAATLLTLPTWLPHTSYVWRVAAVGRDGQGRWSLPGTFTRGWQEAPQPLGPVGTVDPADGVPTFRWTPVASASEYQLQVSTSRYFDAPTRTQAGTGTESCFTTRTSLTPFTTQASARNDTAGACYFSLLGTGVPLHWRVRALDHVVDGAPVVDTTPVVDEGLSSAPPTPVDGLDTSACPAAATPVRTGDALDGGTVPAPSTGGMCAPAHTVEKGAWSSPSTFTHVFGTAASTVAFADLPAVEQPTPSSDVCTGTTCRDFPTVSWTRVPDAQWYRLSVALDPDFTNIHAVVETPAQSWTPTNQWRDSTAGQAYYVVVQPCTIEPTADGAPAGCAEPSRPLSVRKSSPKLAPAQPAQAALLAGPEVVLSWQPFSAALAAAVDGPATSEAYAYHVQVTTADNPDFVAAGLIEDAVVDSPSHAVAGEDFPDGTYLWRVQAVDASGHRLPWSLPRTFTRDTTAPTFTVVGAARLSSTGPVVVRFSEPVRGVDARSTTLSGVLASVALSADATSARLSPGRALIAGAAHVVTVTSAVRDRAGNRLVAGAVPTVVDPTVDDRSSAMVLRGSWKRLTASNAVARTWSRSVPTVAAPTAATTVVSGRAAEIRGCVGPTHGLAELWTDGVRVGRVDTYRSYSGCGVLLGRASFATPGVHRVEVRGTGAHGAHTSGTAVAVDAVVAVR